MGFMGPLLLSADPFRSARVIVGKIKKQDCPSALGRITQPHPDKCASMAIDFHEAVESPVAL